jgi:hypothetical protein
MFIVYLMTKSIKIEKFIFCVISPLSQNLIANTNNVPKEDSQELYKWNVCALKTNNLLTAHPSGAHEFISVRVARSFS